MRKLTLLFTMLISICAYTKENPADEIIQYECKEEKWPFKRKEISKNELYKIFKTTPEPVLIRYAFYELFNAPKNSVLMPVLHYLGSTTKNQNLKGYYESMGYIATKYKSTPLVEVKKWPTKQVEIFSLGKARKDVCEGFTQSLKVSMGGK